MALDTNRRLRPAEGTVAIRCYNQGLGDCFLLAFPCAGRPDDPFYVVIDCGVAHGTPDEVERMRQVVDDIAAATGQHLDVLALTHQHYDHVSGFFHAKDLWEQITVDQLYLPWTENRNDPDAPTIGDAARRMNLAANQAAEQAAWPSRDGSRSGLCLTGKLLAAGSESFGARTSQVIEQAWEAALGRCSEAQRVYCEPGDVLSLRGTGVKAYVLGPPRLRNRDGKDLLSEKRKKPLVYLLEDREEMYSYEHTGLASRGVGSASSRDTSRGVLYANAQSGDTPGLASALLECTPSGDEHFDRYCPFDSTLRISWDGDQLDCDDKTRAFFEHYMSEQTWRRVDDDWLEATSDIALRAGEFTNNLSLALAFELPQSRQTLLFVGDAQVGNWLSWHQIGQWWPRDASEPSRLGTLPHGPADMDDMLGRVAFYKVGHHGSHNATIREHGLERMPDGLIAYIPVSVPVAQDVLGYCPMPFYPLLLALQRKARGAVFLANGKLLEPLPEGANRHTLEACARESQDMLSAKYLDPESGTEPPLEEKVPLWIEFTLDDQARA